MHRRKVEAEKAYLSLRELSQQLGVSYRHIHRAVKDGKVRVIRLGTVLRVPQHEVVRILEHGF
jgi:excisionase family DNA binding protein